MKKDDLAEASERRTCVSIEMQRSAVISECGRFRYRLSRDWAQSKPVMVFVMLNPSTADASQDDPTIRKCVGFAERNGFGAIDVVNLYAYRATDPTDLRRAGYPVGPDNDEHIVKALPDSQRGGMVICAWGVNARGLSRPALVLSLLKDAGVTAHALRLTADGIPWHPLMLPYSCSPLRMNTQVRSHTAVPNETESSGSEKNA